MGKTNNFLYSFLFILLILLCTASCNTIEPPDPPPPPPPVYKDTITVTVEDVTHRSITVNIKTTVNNPKSSINLFRIYGNTAELLRADYPITVSDTSIIDEGLELSTTYTYYAVRIDTTGERKDSSNIVEARTLNATNFNYTWQEFTIGEWNSVLYDVWGTDENNVYAVGTVMFNDTAYGVIKWNGNEWTSEKRIGGLRAIHGFSGNDIWTVGGGVYHFDGVEWNKIDSYTSGGQSIPLDTALFNNLPYTSVWGTSSSNMYFGNSHGRIIHWDGNKASVVYIHESDVVVNDLDGYSSDFIIGIGIGFTPPLLAIYYNGVSWNKLPIENDPSLRSVAIVSRNHIYFAGSGIYELKWNNFYRIYTSGYFMYDIEYNRQMGVTVAAGPFDGVYINNGIEWRDYRSQISTDNTAYSGIFLINNTVFCVGSTLNEAKIIIGKNN